MSGVNKHSSGHIVRLSDYGIHPGQEVTLALYELFQQHSKDTTFVFEKGDYSFRPHPEMCADYRLSNTDVLPHRMLGIWMKQMENCVLQGNGAQLLFAGHMQPVTMDHCRHVRLENMTIDWEAPLVAEGTVVAYDDHSVDLFVDPKVFPHRHVNGWLEFYVGAGEWYPLWRHLHNQFNETDRCIRRDSGDSLDIKEIVDIGDSVYRFISCGPIHTALGNTYVLRHNERMHAGIFAEKCEDVTVEDVTVHSCGGLGCLAQFCKDLTYCRVHFVPNIARGRKVSNGRDDGMHITCCSGTVNITECTFIGLMDDPINVHGCCVASDEVVDQQTLRCRYGHYQAQGFLYWAEPGDEIAFIERKHMSIMGTARVAAYELETMDKFRLTLCEPMPAEVLELAEKGGLLAVDNLTHTAAFTCSKNRFGSCRARGVLISTPEPVRIADNYFASSGSAILVAGDSNEWFESGECHDVEIRNNVFTDACLSSMYQFCEGVISICPVVPEPKTEIPYHKNIRITDNIFDCAETPVLYAFSCDGLTFARNRILKSPAAEKWHPANWRMKLSYCRDVVLEQNEWIGLFGENMLEEECCENIVMDMESQ